MTRSTEQWLTRAQIARHHGIARSTVTRRAETLKASGRLTTKLADDGSELIDLASYDAEIARTIDGVRAGASKAHKERRAETAPKDEPAVYRGLPGQPAAMLFVALDEIVPSLTVLLDRQSAILDQVRDRASEIAAADSPKMIEAKLLELWRDMRDEMLAANETCGLPYVRVALS